MDVTTPDRFEQESADLEVLRVALDADFLTDTSVSPSVIQPSPGSAPIGSDLTIQVKDAVSMAGIESVRVSVKTDSAPVEGLSTEEAGVTNRDGQIVFRNLQPGSAQAIVSKTGYTSLSGESGAHITLATGETTNAEMFLRRILSLSGKVTNTAGEGIASASVTANREVIAWNVDGLGWRQRGETFETLTDSEGTFQFSDLWDNKIYLSIHAEGYIPVNGKTVHLPNSGVHIVLQESGENVVAGEVIDRVANRPLEHFSVTLVNEHTGEPLDREAILGPRGTFRFEDVPIGVWWRVMAAATGYSQAGWSYCRIREEGDSSWVTVLMAPSISIEGVVVNRSGRPVEGASVGMVIGGDEIRGWQRSYSGNVVTDPAGVFRFAQAPSGVFFLEASHNDYAAVKSETLRCEPGHTLTDVRIVLPENSIIEGHVYLPGGAPASGQPVSFTKCDDGNILVGAVDTDENGFYRKQNLAAGTYWIQLKHPGKHPDASKQVDLDEGETKVVDFGQQGVRLKGTVTRAGIPTEDAMLVVDRPEIRCFFVDFTNPDGTYEFDYLFPGRFHIGVQHRRGHKKYYSGYVDIPENVEEFVHDIELPNGKISGIVFLPDRRGVVPSATVGVFSEDPIKSVGVITLDVVTSDEDGRFMVDGYPFGEYMLTATKEGYGQGSTRLELKQGADDVQVVLEMKDNVTLKIIIQDPDSVIPVNPEITILDHSGTPVSLEGNMRTLPGGIREVDIAPGYYAIKVLAYGYTGEVRTVNVVPGENPPVNISLVRGSPVRFSFRLNEEELVRPNQIAIYDSHGLMDNAFIMGRHDAIDCFLHPGPGSVTASWAGFSSPRVTFQVPPPEPNPSIQPRTVVFVSINTRGE